MSKFVKFTVASFFIVFSSLSLGIGWSKDWQKITVGVEGAFPPFNAMTAAGELIGLDIDVMKEVCNRLGLDCTIVAQDWDSQIPSLLAGKFDVILTAGPNPQRRQVIDFSDPYVIIPNTFLVLADSPLVDLPHKGKNFSVDSEEGRQALEDIKKKLESMILGASLSTSQLQFIEENFSKSSEIRTYKSSQQAVLDLEGGRIDAQFDNIVFARDKAEASKGILTLSGPLLVGSVMATNVCLGVRKQEPELLEMLNKALHEMREDGTLARLSEKWFKVDLSPKDAT